MSLLFETIKLQNGILYNLDLHNARMNKARSELFGCPASIDLQSAVIIPKDLYDQVYKCRIIYSKEIEKIEFSLYIPKPVRTLKIVKNDKIEYKYKFVERKCFDDLLAEIETDDILIVKQGRVTDTSYSNIVFYDGEKLVTPSAPLFYGIKREYLLKKKIITEQNIILNDLKQFKCAYLINAMLDLETGPMIKIENIISES